MCEIDFLCIFLTRTLSLTLTVIAISWNQKYVKAEFYVG